VADFVLAVDLDGVCADHASAFRAIVAMERGLGPDDLPPQTTWDFLEWDLGPTEFDELHRRAVLEHRMFRTMPVVEGAPEVLWRLSDAGVWIRIVTHRLYTNWGHAVAAADTVAWLDAAGIPYRDLCFLGRKPEVEADLYVEDAPGHISELRAAGNDVVVFDQPYNRGLPAPRATGWSEVESLVVEMRLARGDTVEAPLPLPDVAERRLRSRLGSAQRGAGPVDG
jgi:5'(3')-deoxyribonucleotidase